LAESRSTFEGGVYAVLGTDSQIHEPINLSQATRQDSLRWSFVRIRRDLLSVHKAGPIDELAEIRPHPTPW